MQKKLFQKNLWLQSRYTLYKMKLGKNLDFIECILYFNEHASHRIFIQAAYGILFSFAFCDRIKYTKTQIELKVIIFIFLQHILKTQGSCQQSMVSSKTCQKIKSQINLLAKAVLLFFFQKAMSLILQVHLYSAELFDEATWQLATCGCGA